MNDIDRQIRDEHKAAIAMLSRRPETTAGMSLVEAVRAIITALITASAVVEQARRGFGTNEDIARAHAFDPVSLSNAIRTYDAVTGPARDAAAQAALATPPPPRPIVVCLCGSTRFWRTFQQAGLAETMAGRIVLSIGAASGTDDEHFGNLPPAEYDRVKAMLDELHLRKIDMADEVLILNVDGYIGESTARELAYAQSLGKQVRYWEERPEL